MLLFLLVMIPVVSKAERDRKYLPEKEVMSDSIMQQVFLFSPLYSKMVDEYHADVYMKGRLKVHKTNKLVKYIPSMFKLEDGVNDYIIESVSEMNYRAPDIYDRKVKAVSSTIPRNKGELTDVTDFLNMNVYSSSMMSDKLLSPLNKESGKYYTYLLDTISESSNELLYKIRIEPKFKGTQLVHGYMWVSDRIWSVRELYMEGQFDMVEFKMHTHMGEEGEEEFLPVNFNLNLNFKFVGNHLEMDITSHMKYHEVKLYQGQSRRKSQKKHSHDLSEFYRLTCDSSQLITDKLKFASLRPIPLKWDEDLLYQDFEWRKDTLMLHKAIHYKPKKRSSLFWGQLGDMLVSNYNLNISGVGSIRCSPIINPVMFSYSHSNGISYKQKFKFNKIFPNEHVLKITPQIGYNFTHKELYLKAGIEWLYWPEHIGSFNMEVGNGNRIYSSVVEDKLKEQRDNTFNFDNVSLDYFKDVYFNLYHTFEPANCLLVKTGVSIHWRNLIENKDVSNKLPVSQEDWLKLKGIRSRYNSFAPRIRIEWTPGTYYYMNGRRKMNVGSSLPTFSIDYEVGLKGVLGSTDGHERYEFDVQQKVELNRIRSLAYRVGGGVFTRMDNMYFVDFVNFSRSNLPVGWNDEIGGTFHLLDRRWYNSSSKYIRGNVTYESPFILLRPLNRWLGTIQQERLYAGVLLMPHLNPYIEIGYGIGTHVFDVGAFVSSMNGEFDTVGFKFTFELFND